jgi:hypothetical protein
MNNPLPREATACRAGGARVRLHQGYGGQCDCAEARD